MLDEQTLVQFSFVGGRRYKDDRPAQIETEFLGSPGSEDEPLPQMMIGR